jgi:23S rRNA pseudouridine2605 synthase
MTNDSRVTLDRLFSKLGIASRGVSQKWIREGRVQVNGQIMRNPDLWVSWPSDSIRLDGAALAAPARRFFLFHKPKGCVTTHSDEKGRKTIFELLPKDLGFIHSVGRLDQATSGLLLLTNDSELSSFLTDPKNQIHRVYLVSVRGKFTEKKGESAIRGVSDEGDLLKCEEIQIQKSSERETHLQVTLTEGKNREIRRLFKALGNEVTRLRRIQFGPFQLENLLPGEWKEIPHAQARALTDSGRPLAPQP